MPALKVGNKAPDFTLPDETGNLVKLSSLKGKKVILYFYPKDDTPGCTTQACGFRDEYPSIEEAGALVLGISPDGAKSHTKFKTKQKLPFSLLSDEDHKVAEKYGAWGEKSMYGKKYMGILRSHFVIDEAGKLVDVQIGVSPKDSVRLATDAVRVA
jgi:peroxiredoxin Q/BCP